MEEVQKLQVERVAARARLEWLDRKVAACKIILEEEDNFTAQSRRVKVEQGEKAKTIELVKEIVMASGTAGILPREVREEIEKVGLNPGPQVVSNALSRWKARDYTIEIGGRHYWKAYLSEDELQKAKPRKMRGVAGQAWEPTLESLAGV